MEEHFKNLIDPFVESAGSLGGSLGISKVVSQIYALLYISSQPLCLDDICDLLKMSKGNVCMNMKYLEQWSAVKKIWIKGSRKDYYEADRNVLKVVRNRLKEGLTRRMADFIKQIEDLEKLINGKKTNRNNKDIELIKAFQNRIKEIKNLNNLINKAFTISETFLK